MHAFAEGLRSTLARDPTGATRIPRAAWAVWQRADCVHLAAALSFYAALSLAPFVIVLVAALNWWLGSDRATQYLLTEIANLAGAPSARFVDQIVASHHAARHGLSALIGTGALLFSASATFAELQHALNRVFGDNGNRAAWKKLLRTRVLALLLVVGVALLAIASLGITARVHASLDSFAESSTLLAFVADEIVSFVVLTIAFAAVLHVLPDCPPATGAATRGALVAAALFCIGKFGIGWYLGRVALGSAYGAAGALVVIMFWIYCSSLILLIGATIARVLEQGAGRRFRDAAIDSTGCS